MDQFKSAAEAYRQQTEELCDILSLELSRSEATDRLESLCQSYATLEYYKAEALVEEVGQHVRELGHPKFRIDPTTLREYLGDKSSAPEPARVGPKTKREYPNPSPGFMYEGGYEGETVFLDHYGILRETPKALCVALEPPAKDGYGLVAEAAWIPKSLCSEVNESVAEIAEFFEVHPITYEG